MVVWKYKTPVITTASQRAEVLVQTHPLSNITWEKTQTSPNPEDKLELLSCQSLDFSLDCKLLKQLEKQHFLLCLANANSPSTLLSLIGQR